MNQKIKYVLGIVAFVFGGIFLLDAIFVERLEVGNESVVSAVRGMIALSLFGIGYYFGFRKPKQ